MSTHKPLFKSLLITILGINALFCISCQKDAPITLPLESDTSETLSTASTENDTSISETTNSETTNSETTDSETTDSEITVSETTFSPDISPEENTMLSELRYYYPYFLSTSKLIWKTSFDSITFDRSALIAAYHNEKNYTLKDYFSSISWISRGDVGYDNIISLSLEPTSLMFCQNASSFSEWMARSYHAFVLITAAYETDENWDHPDSLKPQFYCHAIFAGNAKTPWNIEPACEETSFLVILENKGNPLFNQ